MRFTRCLIVLFLVPFGVLHPMPILAGEGRDHPHGGEKAHVHGVASLNLVLADQRVNIELDSPAANIVGFEHAPATEAEHKALNAVVDKLRDVDRLFVFDGAAGCRLGDIKIASALLEAEHSDNGHRHGHEEEREEERHADFRAAYFFDCRDPARLERLTVGLFEGFPGMESLRVQFIIGDKQGGAELNQANRIVSLR